MQKEIIPYRQNGMTCAVACLLMILEYYGKINRPNKFFEYKYYEMYQSKYTEGTPLSAIAWHLVKNNINTEIIHSEDEIFTNRNNTFNYKLYRLLLDEYKYYLTISEKKGLVIKNGEDIDSNYIKEIIDKDKFVILAGQVNDILHAILICDYHEDEFLVCDPLYKKKKNYTMKYIDDYMETPIGKWCVTVSKD